MALAFLTASFLIWKLSRDEEQEEEQILDAILVAVFFGLLGSRIHYILLHLKTFTPNLIRTIHLINFPGLSFQGGLIIGTIAVVIFLQFKKISLWQVGDIAVLGLSLGQAIARLGCFLNGCCYGNVTKLPWGVFFPGIIGKRHPTQIYESLLDFLIFYLLLKIYRKTYLLEKEKRGYGLLSYFIFSGTSRFLIEFLRGDSVYWRGIKIAQLISIIIVLLAVIIFIIRYRFEIKEWIINLILKLKAKSEKLKFKAKK